MSKRGGTRLFVAAGQLQGGGCRKGARITQGGARITQGGANAIHQFENYRTFSATID